MISILLTLLSTNSLWAREITYKQPNDPVTLIQDLETNTGLIFSARCSTCPTNGWINATTDTVHIGIYEDQTTDPRIQPVVLTPQLQGRLNVLVNRQVAKATPPVVVSTRTPTVPILPTLRSP